MGGFSLPGGAVPVNYMPQYSFPEYNEPQYPQAIPVQAPAVVAATSVALRAFPALALAITKFRMMKIPMTVERLWSMVKRFGPVAVTTVGGGIITAQVVSDLLAYKATHKSRRMNVTNVRALRRGLRRLKGFDRLASRVSMQLHKGGRARSRRTSRRCATCKQSPCCC